MLAIRYTCRSQLGSFSLKSLSKHLRIPTESGNREYPWQMLITYCWIRCSWHRIGAPAILVLMFSSWQKVLKGSAVLSYNCPWRCLFLQHWELETSCNASTYWELHLWEEPLSWFSVCWQKTGVSVVRVPGQLPVCQSVGYSCLFNSLFLERQHTVNPSLCL